MPTMVMEAMVVMDMVVTDTVATVERDQLSHTTVMVDTEDTDAEDMVVTDMVDTVARDLLMPMLNQKLKLKPPQKPGTDMDTLDSHTLMVDMDTHTLMEVTTILERDLPNHQPTTVMDTVVVMDMAVTDTVDTVERDPLSHTTDMGDTEDMEVTDMAVTATDMAVKPYKKLIASII